MTIRFKCHSCGAGYKVPNEKAGRKAKCVKCSAIIIVPSPVSDEQPISVKPSPVSDEQPIAVKPAIDLTGVKEPQLPGEPAPNDIPQAEVLPVKREDISAIAPPRELTAIKLMVDQGNHLKAVQALKRVEASLGNHPGYHYIKGLAYLGLGNYQQALDGLILAINSGVSNPEVFAAKGQAEVELSKYVAAVESLDTALELAGIDVPDYMALLAKAYDGAKMPRDAMSTWSALAVISPNHPALIERKRQKEEIRARRHSEQTEQAMLQMQKEQRASDTACWICIILRILLECL